MFCITTGLVQMDSYIGIAGLVLLVTMHLVLCFFPCRKARDARHHGKYDQKLGLLVLDVVPRAVLLVLSQAPNARHHGRHGPQDSVKVHRYSSSTRFSPSLLLSYVCLGPDSVLHSWRFRSCSSSRSSMTLSRCVPFHCRQACVARRHALLGPFLEVQFLDKLFSPVVVLRQVPFLSGQCAALPVKTPQVQFLDEVLVITTDAVV